MHCDRLSLAHPLGLLMSSAILLHASGMENTACHFTPPATYQSQTLFMCGELMVEGFLH